MLHSDSSAAILLGFDDVYLAMSVSFLITSNFTRPRVFGGSLASASVPLAYQRESYRHVSQISRKVSTMHSTM